MTSLLAPRTSKGPRPGRVITRDGELLLLRSRHGDYEFPGGGVEADESAQGAVTRELREECGLLDVSG